MALNFVALISYVLNYLLVHVAIWCNKYVNCCDLFEPQKCEYDICYSFNSAVNIGRNH